jgi:hypothetical protein
MKNKNICYGLFILALMAGYASAYPFTPRANIDLTSGWNITFASWVNASNYTGNGFLLTNVNAVTFDGESDFGAIGQSIIPSADGTLDLGSSSKRWNDIYLDDLLYLKNPAGGATRVQFTNSSGSNIFHIAYDNPTKTWYFTQSGVSDLLTYTENAAQWSAVKGIAPSADKSINLGNWSNGFNSIYLSGDGALGVIAIAFTKNNTISSIGGSDAKQGALINLMGVDYGGTNPGGIGLRRVGSASNIRFVWYNGTTGVIQYTLDGVSLSPGADNLVNLGSQTYSWANISVGKLILNGYEGQAAYSGYITGGNVSPTSYAWTFVAPDRMEARLRLLPDGNESRRVQLLAYPVTVGIGGLIMVSLAAGDKQFIPAGDNAYSLGTASYRWSDLRSVLINGADYCFQNNLCLTECVINGVQDICVVDGLPTKEQAEIMGLADVKDYAEYKTRMNGTIKNEDEFKDKKIKAFKNDKRDFVFNRTIISSLLSDRNTTAAQIETRLRTLEEENALQAQQIEELYANIQTLQTGGILLLLGLGGGALTYKLRRKP